METPKPPASSQLRRPSTRPYARRRPAGAAAEPAAAAEPEASPAAVLLDGASPARRAVAATEAAIETAIAAATAPLTATPTKKPRSRAKPKAVAAAVAEAVTDAPQAALDLALEAAPLAEASALTPSQIGAQIDASLSVLENLLDALEAPAPAAPQQIPEAAAPLLTALPSPRELPTGLPRQPAPPPGLVPRGDSRSLRRGDLYALVYRVHCFVITRHGHVGQLGHWSAVEYPTPAAASHAYARGASHWVSEGFSDYRG